MKKVLNSIIFSFIIFLSLGQPVAAKETNTVMVGRDEVISSDLVKYGSSLLVLGKIDGDAYLVGGLVNFDGIVTGDLFIAAGKVNVNGTVGGNLRIVGGDMNINSKIGKNLMVLGGNAQIDSISLPGSFLAAVGNIESKADVALGGKIAVGRGYLDGSFGKDVKISQSSELILGPNCKITGSLIYGGAKEAKIDKNAKIAGTVTYNKNLKIIPQNISSALKQGYLVNLISKVKMTTLAVSFIFSLAAGFILLKLTPGKSQKFMDLFERHLVSSFGWGLLMILVSSIIIIFLCASIIGIPLAIFYIFILVVMVFLAKIIGSLVLGRRLLLVLNLGERRGWALLIGLVIYYLISPMAVVGIIFRIFVITTSLGVFIVYYRNREILDVEKVGKGRIVRKKRGRRS